MSDSAPQTGRRVVFYQLTRKFVDSSESVPEEAAEVMYYTLSVGHHTGIIDCFSEKISCSPETYDRVLALFDADSPEHYKLDGINRSGEIQVDISHLQVLDAPIKDALARVEKSADPDAEDVRSWLSAFSECLDAIRREPAVYLMGRMRQQ